MGARTCRKGDKPACERAVKLAGNRPPAGRQCTSRSAAVRMPLYPVARYVGSSLDLRKSAPLIGGEFSGGFPALAVGPETTTAAGAGVGNNAIYWPSLL